MTTVHTYAATKANGAFEPLEYELGAIGSSAENFPMSKVNEAMERLKEGKAKYRFVLVSE